ncbi:Zinc finger protein 6 [Linum grandiflorum]
MPMKNRSQQTHREYDFSIIHSSLRPVQPPNHHHYNPLGLNLGSHSNTEPPNLELNLMGGYHVRTFACQFCSKQYDNPHALGGHQNAHKRERAFLKWQQQTRFNSLELSPIGLFYSPLRAHGLLGSHYGYRVRPRNALGVNALSSMIHKPIGSVVGNGFRAHGFGRFLPMMSGPSSRPWTSYSRMINPMNNNVAGSSSNQRIIDFMQLDGTDGTPPTAARNRMKKSS